MGERIQRIKVAPEHTFRGPDGEAIPVRDLGLGLVREDGQIQEIRATFRLDWEDWRRVDAHGWFHLAPEDREPQSEPFEEGVPVEVEAVLDAGPAMVLEIAAEDAYEAGALVLDAAPTDPLVREASWAALGVTQEDPDIPGVSLGFATRRFGG